MSDVLLLGIDIGTTNTKAVVVSPQGAELAFGSAATTWAAGETAPLTILRSALAAAEQALAGVPRGRVVAVGIASFAETGVLLDADDRPVLDCIAWHDPRGTGEIEHLAAEVGRAAFMTRAGIPLGPMPTVAKLRWLHEHRPEVMQAGRRWLSVAEWVATMLGGRPGAELSLACRTGLFDRETKAWWPEVVDWCGARPEWFGEPVVAGTPAGVVTAGPARLSNAMLSVAGHDCVVAAFGAGVTEPGDVLDSCGTAESFVRIVAPPMAGDAVLEAVSAKIDVGWHVVPDRLALQTGGMDGRCLTRVLGMLGARDGAARDAVDHAALAEAGRSRVRFTGLTGDSASLEAIGWDVTPGGVWWAAVDEAARVNAEVIGTLDRLTGATKRIIATGGWTRSEALMTAKRAHLDVFERSGAVEPGARGAALLAGGAAGILDPIATAVQLPASRNGQVASPSATRVSTRPSIQ